VKVKQEKSLFFISRLVWRDRHIIPIPVSGIFGAGKTAEELPEHFKRGYEAAPPSVWDPAARVTEQDADGVSGEVLYTSFGMFLYGLDDAELRTSCFGVYNDFVAEYTSHDSKRLAGLGLIDLEDIGAGVKEMQRIAKKGLRGVMIWASPPEDRPYTHPDYDPFWAAAQDLGLPVSFHILTGRGGPRVNLDKILTSYIGQPHEIQMTLATLIFSGILERFPKLQIVSAENDVSWLYHFMYRLDHAYDRFRHFEGVNLSMLPSEYVKRQLHASFQFEEVGMDLINRFGAENIMWSSDYPHTDSTWPRSREFIDGHFQGIPGDVTQKIVGANAAHLYHLD
jgi:predicted TIM-barrel fold metal-dependent hydrolase